MGLVRADEAVIEHLEYMIPRLERLAFGEPVAAVYNPLDYARRPFETYLRRYGAGTRRVLFLGMNPGPWGMAQTGVPFGEVAAVRDWMGIDEPVGRPASEHPRRPIDGFACSRSEVSGRRLWGLFADRFGTAARFFSDHLVLNYCPLVFMAESGRNITPDKLPKTERDSLFALCDAHLATAIAAYQPEWLVGVGAFARRRLDAVVAAESRLLPVGAEQVVQILHPSPASPAANRGWAAAATAQLVDAGVWAS